MPQAYAQQAGSRTLDAAAASAVSDAMSLPAVAPEAIVDAAPPRVAGTYNGTVQGRSQGSLIARGPLLITLVQNGTHISGNFRFELVEDGRRPVTRDFSGTVGALADGGAILHVTFSYPGQTAAAGGWAKLEGGSLIGKGWQVPDPPNDPYEQLLFWSKAE